LSGNGDGTAVEAFVSTVVPEALTYGGVSKDPRGRAATPTAEGLDGIEAADAGAIA